jgi:predicted esterase
MQLTPDKFFITLISALTFHMVSGQQRYLEETIDSVDIQTYTYITKNGENLSLDVYTPYFDDEDLRPVILYVHGGGFSGGSRNDDHISEFCKRLGHHGFVAVSISYRLTRKNKPEGFGCDCPAAEKRNTFQAAVEDIQDATYFLINNRDALGIDPQNIILAGSSAGAEASLITAYQPPNCYGLDTGPVSYAGVISMAGAIPDIETVYDESGIPSLFFHGTCDKLVPFATAPHHYCQPSQSGYLELHGAYTLSGKLSEIGVPHWLHTTCGGGHELATTPMDQHFDVIIRFLMDFIIDKAAAQLHTIVFKDTGDCDFSEFEFCKQ